MSLRASFRDLPIQHKLRTIILLISGLAFGGACTVFLCYQWVTLRDAMARRLEVMAEILADQSTAAVEFAQEPQAAAILSALKADRQIVIAALYTREGKVFAQYLREGASPDRLPSSLGPDGREFREGDLLIFQPLHSSGERIGTLCLRSDLAAAWRGLLISLATVALVLLGAAIAVTLLSWRLGRAITEPVLRLANVVQAVSTRRDYSIRVESQSRDELGQLIVGFNDMLSQIQERDSALALARDELEQRVGERTHELQEEIAERKATESLLQEKDARLMEAQEIAHLGSWEWNLSTNRVTWSDEVYRTYSRLPAQFEGGYEAFLASAHPDDRAALKESLERACRKREPFSLDYRIMRPDGSVRVLHAQGKVVLGDDGRVLRLVGTLQDITERRHAEEAIQDLNRELQTRMKELGAANKELEGFSYSVSHDLRAPLRAISGYSRMLVEDYADRVDGEGRRYLDVITKNAVRMGQLIDDLLAFSQLGRTAVKYSTIDLGSLAKDVFAEIEELNPNRTIDLRVSPLPAGYGDAAMFRQVLVNLLSNAVKYTRGREPTVIEMGATVGPTETVYHVRDNGVGFDMQYANKLFGVFQRLHSSEEFEGTGVGLALVQRIIQRHGGRVWGEGKLNEGATFYFTLPANAGAKPTSEQTPQGAAAPSQARPAGEAEQPRESRLLVAEA